MINLTLTEKRGLAFSETERIYAGDNNITDINITLPDNIGSYPSEECEFKLYAVFEDGTYIVYPFEGSTIPVTTDLTAKKQVVKLFVKITKDDNILGQTNGVALEILKSPDGNLEIYPRGELDARISALEEENERKAGDIAALTESLSEKDRTISGLNSRVSGLSGRVSELTDILRDRDTVIHNLSEQISPNRFQAKTVTPSGSAALVSADEGYSGLSSVTVEAVSPSVDRNITPSNIREGVTVLGVTGTYGGDLSKWLARDKNRELFTAFFGGTKVPAYIAHYQSRMEHAYISEGVVNIESYAFIGCGGLTSVRLPNTLEGIADNAFNNCKNLFSVNFPSGLLSIGERAFYYCESLEHIDLPSTLTDISSNAFENCHALREIIIPSGITFISNMSFYHCDAAKYIVIPDSVEYIRSMTFGYARALERLDLTAMTHVPYIQSDTFIGVSAGSKFVVKNAAMKAAFSSATNWAVYADKFVTEEEYENGNS